MTELIEIAKIWFLDLGRQYGVNPIVFGSIYVGAIPLFALSMAWLVKNHKMNKSIVLPALLSTFFFISAYLYLIIEGENVPWWVYAIIVSMVAYSGWTTYRRIRRKMNKIDNTTIINE